MSIRILYERTRRVRNCYHYIFTVTNDFQKSINQKIFCKTIGLGRSICDCASPNT